MTCTPEDIKQLFAEFPQDAIHWRAQSVTKDGTSALALAYIDARDVMDRLDSVCGPANWQDRYEFFGPRTVCYLSIRIDGEWITKADGAGDTDVESEKGAISDALKRSAVKWGIGRYLYDLGSPWVPCQCTEFNGKMKWKKFTSDPWNYVKGTAPKPVAATPKASSAAQKKGLLDIDADLTDCHSILDVDKCAKVWAELMKRDGWAKDFVDIARPKFQARRDEIHTRVQFEADAAEQFPEQQEAAE